MVTLGEGVLVGLAVGNILFALAALWVGSFIFARIWRRSAAAQPRFGRRNHEDLLITARNTGGKWLLTWSYYSALTGAWMLPALGQYGYQYGLCGMLFFSVTYGICSVVSAALSRAAYTQLREGRTLPQSLGARYGRAVEVYTFLVMVLMSECCLAAEYAALASIMHTALGVSRLWVLGAAGFFSALHVLTGGGVLVGMFTDQFNGTINIASFAVLLAFLIKATTADIKPPQAASLIFGPQGLQHALLSCVGTLHFNLTISCFFESLWQKHIACKRKPDLWPSSLACGAIIACMATLFGMAGVLTAWRDHGEGGSRRQLLGQSWFLHLDRDWQQHTISDMFHPYHYWYGLALLLHVAIASQVAVHSWNNALLSSFFGAVRSWPRQLVACRVCAVALNLLALLIAAKGVDVLGMYQIPITFGACLLCPLFLSICNKTLFRHAAASDILVPALAGLVGCCVCGVVTEHHKHPHASATELVQQGLRAAFYTSNLQWPFVLVSLLVPCLVYAYMILPKLLQDDMELFEAVVE